MAFGMSLRAAGKHPSCWKHLSRSAHPSRLEPVLLLRIDESSFTKVKCSISSSMSHWRFIYLDSLRLVLAQLDQQEEIVISLFMFKYSKRHTTMAIFFS